MIGAELLEVSPLKLAPAVRVMAKQGPKAGACGDVFPPHVDAGMLLRESTRPDAVDEHPHAEASGGSLTRLTLGPGDRLDVGFSSPCLSKKGHHALGCLRGNDLGKSIGVCSALFMRFVSRNCAVSAIISTPR